MSARESAHDHEVLDFLGEWALDRDRGRVHSLGHYLARFPGREAAIAREYLQLQDDPVDATTDDRRVGPFDLVRELGRGGQGTVGPGWRCATCPASRWPRGWRVRARPPSGRCGVCGCRTFRSPPVNAMPCALRATNGVRIVCTP